MAQYTPERDTELALYIRHREHRCNVNCFYCGHEKDKIENSEVEKMHQLHQRMVDAYERSKSNGKAKKVRKA